MLRELNYKVKLTNSEELKKEVEDINFEFDKLYEKVSTLTKKVKELNVEFNSIKGTTKKGGWMEELFRRFEIIDKKNLNKFKVLVDEKNLSREDLILILRTLSLKKDTLPQ